MPALLKTVSANSHLTLHYRIGLEGGHDIINTFTGKPATLLLGENQLHPSLEKILLGMSEGQHCCLTLLPEQAFGPHHAELLQSVNKVVLQDNFDKNKIFSVGDWLAFDLPGGGRLTGQLKRLDQHSVWFDFNHPLAGLTVIFETQIIAIL